MSDPKDTDVKEQVQAEETLHDKTAADVPENPENMGHNEENPMPSPEEEEAALKKKYGGMLPKKPPLISKDHERAFFDSADWALGKQGAQAEKPKGPLEALRPKLQPTHQQTRSRRSAYASAESEDGGNTPEDANNNQ
ncbi:uncharacterized protein A4U43_C07F34300 [Asparagus officinalis]|uniref:Negatively light-regulated protein n=1 Tax=Asparagus officinalis TaxID=4686 RepID=A0A5P1EK37_ASPOF|nr:uncharacterized protein LOC109850596 [Asparagus officinalis]ONK65159.1 uncharacterized protein A4U43_C07F34300 [Asparagus officinalis]